MKHFRTVMTSPTVFLSLQQTKHLQFFISEINLTKKRKTGDSLKFPSLLHSKASGDVPVHCRDV